MQITIEPFLDFQITSLIALIKQLQNDLPTVKYISGHSDLDVGWVPATDDPTNCTLVRGKVDPGPLFPWDKVLKEVNLTYYQPNGNVSFLFKLLN